MRNGERASAATESAFVVRVDEKLTAFVELERAIHAFALDLIL
jgi:hypothetical protein